MHDALSFIPLGGIGDVTKNMYLYEYNNQILIVDCGLGFADETMLGVDLLLPDVSYLLQNKKRIVGMLLTHGHEDHIGALPFILPQLLGNGQEFTIYGTPLTAALANEKLKEFGVSDRVQTVEFKSNSVKLGDFEVQFIRVTHSVPDTSHIFIKTPVGNFYHGSDFKFDDTPVDNNISDLQSIEDVSKEGILCLLSDCLGAERKGHTPTEQKITIHFEKELVSTKGKFIVTTYSSNIARINQIVEVSQKHGRKVCFIGRSLLKAKEVAMRLGYIQMKPNLEVMLEDVKQYNDNNLTLIVAGSQGQENSAMSRIASGEHREIKLTSDDTVIFSADPIPGNEVVVYSLIDTLAKKGVRVLYSDIDPDFHVSGHGSIDELSQLITLTQPKIMIPIGGSFRHMVAYRDIAQNLGHAKNNVLLLEDGQEVIFSESSARLGRMIRVKNVYVDEISGAEIEGFVLRDRQKLSEGGIVIILVEVDSSNGQIVDQPDFIVRGFPGFDKRLNQKLAQDMKNSLKDKKGKVTNWVYMRKLIGEICERRIFKDLRRRPLVLPVVIEV